jgi:hypothetical protein
MVKSFLKNLKNLICPITSFFTSHRTRPLLILCMVSIPCRVFQAIRKAIGHGQLHPAFQSSVVLFNGLITNDKFCLGLVSSQKLGWGRGPRVGVGGRTDPANHPEAVRPPSEGEQATKVAGSTLLATEVGCGAAVASSLPTSPGVDSRRGAKRRFPVRALTPRKGEDQ